jgi:hypothetical protein
MTSYYITVSGQRYKVHRSEFGQYRIRKSDGNIAYGGDITDPYIRAAAVAEYVRSIRDAAAV